MPYAAYRPEENFIDNYTSQAKHRWRKRLTHAENRHNTVYYEIQYSFIGNIINDRKRVYIY